MILKLKRTPGIYLIGFMGSGKSTVGRMLADQIGWRFADIDDDVEAAAQTSVTELFTQQGEEEFRRFESEAIRQRVRRIQSGHPMVLALGGGAFTQEATIQLLENNGVTIWLDADFPRLHQLSVDTPRTRFLENNAFASGAGLKGVFRDALQIGSFETPSGFPGPCARSDRVP